MKRLLLALVTMTVMASSAGAQKMKTNIGGNFCISTNRIVADYSGNSDKDSDRNTFQIILKPKIYWYINEKMQFGSYIGLSYSNTKYTNPYNKDFSTIKSPVEETGRSLGWMLSPYFSYRLLALKGINIWAEAYAYAGTYYKVNGGVGLADQMNMWDTDVIYGINVVPVIDIALTEKLALQLHAGVISLGWSGETAYYDDRTERHSSINFVKGDITGLFQSLGNFGVGIVHRF